jgi:hypothetical protein
MHFLSKGGGSLKLHVLRVRDMQKLPDSDANPWNPRAIIKEKQNLTEVRLKYLSNVHY